MIRLPVWSTYLEIINDSRIVREFVLKTDIGTAPTGRGVRRNCPKTKSDRVELAAIAGGRLLRDQRENFLAAKENYLDLISRAESASGNFDGRRTRRPSSPSQ